MLDKLKRQTSSINFIPEIDGLRFFAIVTVVLFHLNTAFAKESGIDLSDAFTAMGGVKTNFSWAWWWVRLDLGVKVFFAISGFVLALPFLRFYLGLSEKEIDLKFYFFRRLTRLEPPFVITLFFFYFVHVIVLKENATSLLEHLGAGLIYGHVLIFGESNPINPVTWSLEIEAQFYVIIPAVMWVLFRWRNIYIGTMGLFVLITASVLFRMECFYSFYWGRTIFAYFSNFAMGIFVCCLYLKHYEWFKVSNIFYDFVGLIAIFCLFYFYKPQHEVGNQLFFNISIALIIITAFKGVFFNWFYTRPYIYVIGGMCYSIYLIHYAFLYLLMKWSRFLWIECLSYSGNLVVQILVCLPLVLLISILFFRYFEQPFMDKQWFVKFMARKR